MTTELTAIVIPADSLPYVARVSTEDRGTYNFISETIGGYFDCAYSTDGSFHGYVHDEGLLNGMPINPIATALFGRILAGPCVVFGTYNGDGESDGAEYSVPTNTVTNVEYLAGAYKIWVESNELPTA